jgi:hypothetical protein|tara:strand:+ start:34 stop:513 length:480 start_codon:yes stop_codon:yes gene_type:complete
MRVRERDRVLEIIKKVNLKTSPLNLDKNNFTFFAKDLAKNLADNFSAIGTYPDLKWCLSTIKKTKVFLKIYQDNEFGLRCYKEEIAKNLNEYSYKSVAVIVDEGISKGYFISLEPIENKIIDKKIKNIRPSKELLISFYNWNIERIISLNMIINKYKKK